MAKYFSIERELNDTASQLSFQYEKKIGDFPPTFPRGISPRSRYL